MKRDDDGMKDEDDDDDDGADNRADDDNLDRQGDAPDDVKADIKDDIQNSEDQNPVRGPEGKCTTVSVYHLKNLSNLIFPFIKVAGAAIGTLFSYMW